MRKPHREQPQWQYQMSSKELVLISKALRGRYTEQDLPKMAELAERLLAPARAKHGPDFPDQKK